MVLIHASYGEIGKIAYRNLTARKKRKGYSQPGSVR